MAFIELRADLIYFWPLRRPVKQRFIGLSFLTLRRIVLVSLWPILIATNGLPQQVMLYQLKILNTWTPLQGAVCRQ